MDVDTDNFEVALASLVTHLPQAKFLALDLEMTGIYGAPGTQVSGGDVPQVQYSKGCAVVGRPYSIVQVGLCLFEERTPGHFDCRPFNVFVFPRPIDERDANGNQVKTDPFLGLSASSIMFLAGNGLDFQRWVTKGVSYTSAATEAALMKAMPSPDGSGGPRAAAGGNGREFVKPNRPADIQLVEDTMKQVDLFVASDEQEMKLSSTNTFLALALRQRIAEKHPSLEIEKRPSASNSNWQERWLLKVSEEGRKQRDAALRSRLLAHIGFRRMWDLLKARRVPIIVHNGFFDLLFLAEAFEGPLPRALADFKAVVHGAFPVIFDTKVFAEAPGLRGRLGSHSALPELAAGLAAELQQRRPPAEGKGNGPAKDVASASAAAEAATPGADATKESMPAEGADSGAGEAKDGEEKKEEEEEEEVVDVSFSFPEGFGRYSEGNGEVAAFHTAGYDAYQTGRIFAYYRCVLGENGLEGFANRIHLMWSAFELSLGDSSDRLLHQGIARYLHDVDTTTLNNKGFLEILKPVLEEGKLRVTFRWCSDTTSLILILYGSDDTAPGASSRQACELCLDALLKKQEEQGRLRFGSLEEHLEQMEAAATGIAAKSAGCANGEPLSKRRRLM